MLKKIVAKASNLIAMASNLLVLFGIQAESFEESLKGNVLERHKDLYKAFGLVVASKKSRPPVFHGVFFQVPIVAMPLFLVASDRS